MPAMLSPRRYFLSLGMWLMLCLSAAPAAANSASVVASNQQIAVFAGGCFWGVDAIFKHVKGVSEVVSGYAGGTASTATYDLVSSGATGHAEAVRVSFDPTQISYPQLLQIFFSVAHDPTQLNRQGPDVGSQYRSVVFYTTAEQQEIAQRYIQQLTAAHTFSGHIRTQVTPLVHFFPAEAYHQNYLARHPYQPYIVINDLPKLDQLRAQFPKLYRR